MAVLRGDSGDGRFLIAGKVRWTGVRPWVAPELGCGEAMDEMDLMDGEPMPAAADALYAWSLKRLGSSELAFRVVVAAVESGCVRDAIFTPEAVAAA